MMFSTRTWRNDGRNVRPDDLDEISVSVDTDELLIRLCEQNRGGPLPFGPFGFPAGEPGAPFNNHQTQMQPSSLQE